MGKVIIVGAGVTGQQIAKRVPSPVVVESDVSKATTLRRELGDVRIVVGDGTEERTLLQAGIGDAETLVVALNDDRASYQTVLNCKPYKNIKTIVAVVNKPDQVPRFQRLGVHSIIVPDLATAQEIVGILMPSHKRVSEIVITRGAAAIGKQLEELKLPFGTSVIGVQREDKLLSPVGDLLLDAMDVVHVSADVEELNAVRSVFLGDHRQLLPFSKILVPVMDESWFETEFTEAVSLAMFCQTGLVGMFPAEAPWLVKKAQDTCGTMAVPFYPLPGYSLDFRSIEDALNAAAAVDLESLAGVEDIVKVLRKEQEGKTHLHGPGEEVEVDLLILRSETLRMIDRVARKPVCVEAVEGSNTPILVARHPDPYASLLFMLDGSPRSNNIASLALRIAIAFGSKVTALTSYDPEHQEAQRMMRHIRRTGEMYGLDIVEDEVEGNPTLEFVSLVKSGEHDLTLVNRACKTVKKDIVRRVYMSAPKSVMVV